jgi:hypothetical protein
VAGIAGYDVQQDLAGRKRTGAASGDGARSDVPVFLQI